MPTYEYKCNKCGKTFEVSQSITAKPVKKCPDCLGTVKRLIGAGGGFLFKGSGFHTTDYRSRSYKESQKKEQQNGSVCPKTTGGKTDCSKCQE